jgi:hypothetical protein
MQAGTNPTLDANAAHPIEIGLDDPRHLGNLTKRMHAINSQISSDTKYDPSPPPRVDGSGKVVKESFQSDLEVSDLKLTDEFLYAVGAAALTVIVITVIIIVDPSLRANILMVQYGLQLAGSAVVLAIMTIVVVYQAMKKNEEIRWYPSLRG